MKHHRNCRVAENYLFPDGNGGVIVRDCVNVGFEQNAYLVYSGDETVGDTVGLIVREYGFELRSQHLVKLP